MSNAPPSRRGPLGSVRGGGRGWIVLAVALGWLTILGTRFVVPAVLPQIRADFAIDNTTAGVAITVVWLTYSIMQFPAGALVDRFGERTLLTVSMATAAVGTAVVAFVPTFLPFVVALALFGFATGLYGPARATVLSRTFEHNDATAIGLVLAAGSLGAAAFPVLANLLSVRLGWRLSFALTAPLFLALAVGMWRTIPTRRVTANDPETTARTKARAVRAAVSTPSVGLATVAMTLMLFVFQGVSAFLPTYFIDVKGLSGPVAGGLFALVFVSGAASQWAAGSAADRFGHGRVLVGTAAFSVVPLVALPVADGVPLLALLAVAIGVRLGVAPVSNAYIVRVLDPEVQGAAWGLVRTTFFVVGSTGSIFVGALADRGSFDVAFLSLAALTAVAAAVYLFLPARVEAV